MSGYDVWVAELKCVVARTLETLWGVSGGMFGVDVSLAYIAVRCPCVVHVEKGVHVWQPWKEGGRGEVKGGKGAVWEPALCCETPV